MPRDRVGIAARNSANWVIAYMGVLMGGGCATLLNGWWTGDELAYGVNLCECSLVLADPQRAARLDGTEHDAKVVVFTHDGPPPTGLEAVWAEGDTATKLGPFAPAAPTDAEAEGLPAEDERSGTAPPDAFASGGARPGVRSWCVRPMSRTRGGRYHRRS